jgi:Bacterial SH3 domain
VRYSRGVDRRRFLQAAAAAGSALALPAVQTTLAQTTGLSAGMLASVTTDQLNVRGGPGASQPAVATLDLGSTVDLLGASLDGAWWRVASDAAVGYVSSQYLQPLTQPSTSGVFDIDLAIPYARQLDAVWCDPADLQMWRGYRQGVASAAPDPELQSAIWDWEKSHNLGLSVQTWDCSPYAVASAAHQWMPAAGFDHFLYDDPMGGSRVLAWLLANPSYQEPSIALVWRGLHYLLVRGVRSMGDPGQHPMDAQILGFYVADPDVGASFWLGQDRFVPIDRWLNEMFTPVSYTTPHTGTPGDTWQNRMVAIQRSWTAAGPTERGQSNATPTTYV